MAKPRRKSVPARPVGAVASKGERRGGGAGAKVMAIALALLAIFSAVPVASARPSWWLLWTAVIAILWLLWQWREYRQEAATGRANDALTGYRPLLLLALTVPLYGMVQSLNITFLLPDILLRVPAPLADFDIPAISLMPAASFMAALRLCGFLLFLMLVISVATRRERVQLMTRVLFWGVVAQAVWALVALQLLGDFALFGEKTSYRGSATGTFVNRNSLATFLGFGLVLGAVLIGRKLGPQDGAVMRVSRPLGPLEKLGTEGLFVLIGMLLTGLALVMTQSRLGLFSAMVGLGVTVLLLWSRAAEFGWRQILVVLGGFVVLGVAALLVGAGGLADRTLFAGSDGDLRRNLYLQVWDMVRMRPMTGFGLDTFGAAFENFRAPPLLSGAYYGLAHNSYLGLWAEMGLVVGSLPPLLLLLAAGHLWRKLRTGNDFPAQAAGALGVMVLGGVHALGDFSLEIPANNYLFLAIVGLGLGVRRAPRATQKPEAAPTPPPREGSGVTISVPGAVAGQ